jgi:glycosyltransferase involved in cell wall biosynthesis
MSTPRLFHAARPPADEGTQNLDRNGGPRTTLRIGLVAPPVVRIPPERYAGTERIVAALADGLVARGHHVMLFASGDSTSGSEVVPVIPRAAWNDGSTGENWAFAMLSAIKALERATDVDLFHSHLDVMGLPLARQSPVPVLTTFHSRLDVPGIFEAVRAFGDAPLVAISASQRRWHPDANWVATIPHGLPLDDVPFSTKAGDYLAVVGRASPDKGIAEAIEVANAASVPLRIAAKAIDPAEIAYLETYIRPALGDAVQYLGELGPGDRDPMLAGALATMMLGAWPEPFGLVAIESLATGTPVIARRAGALPEIIEHGVDGFLVDDLSEAKLAVGLARDLDRTRIRERALHRFGVERMVSAYERLYHAVLGRTPARGGHNGRNGHGRTGDDHDGHDGHDDDGHQLAGARPIARAGATPAVPGR